MIFENTEVSPFYIYRMGKLKRPCWINLGDVAGMGLRDSISGCVRARPSLYYYDTRDNAGGRRVIRIRIAIANFSPATSAEKAGATPLIKLYLARF